MQRGDHGELFSVTL